MKNVLNIENYVNEYYQPAPLTSKRVVRLYRGDSEYIKNFDPKKFDAKSIYGKGTYLTDSRYIATTYTTKTVGGNAEKIIASFVTYGKSGKNARLHFVINYLLAKMIDHTYNPLAENNDGEHKALTLELHDYYSSLTDWVYYPLLPPDPNYWDGSPKTPKHMAEQTKSYKEKLKERTSKTKLLAKKYNKMLKIAVDQFTKERKRYKFILTNFWEKKNDAFWQVWDISIKQGHVSEFDVPKVIIDACYDAEAPLRPEIVEIIKKIWYDQLYNDAVDTHQKYYRLEDKDQFIKDRMREFERDTTDDYAWETLTAFFKYRPVKFREEKEWIRFRKGMKELGYRGIHYLGGKHTGSPTSHNAYVLWEHNKLIRVR